MEDEQEIEYIINIQQNHLVDNTSLNSNFINQNKYF